MSDYLEDDDEPGARSSDPWTSHFANASKSVAPIRAAVLLTLADHGPLTDGGLLAEIGGAESSPRKRRGELRAKGLVEECGVARTVFNKPSLLWRLTEEGRLFVQANRAALERESCAERKSLVIEYPKIETLFNRDKKTFKIIEDVSEFRLPEFGAIDSWVTTEKIHGTNVRVNLSKDNIVTIGGRTANSDMPVKLMQYLNATFTAEKMRELQQGERLVEITLFGEGYGAGIQSGGGYRPDQSFILFDVLINDRWWVEDDEVDIAADLLGVERAPVLDDAVWLPDIVAMVREGFDTYVDGGTCKAEGVVCRPLVPLFDRSGARVMFKLKTKDFARTVGD